MLSRPRLIVPLLALLVALAGSLAGCGGGGEQSNGSQDGGGNGQQGDGGRGQANRGAPETKIALGIIARVNPGNDRRIVLKPRAQVEEQQGGPMVFKIRENANVTLDGQPAEVGDVAQGQQAQVEYVVRNDLNRALSVQLFKVAEQPSGEDGNPN